MKNAKYFCFLVCIYLVPNIAKSQSWVPLDTLIQLSSYCFEAEVIKDSCFMSPIDGDIYTAHTLKISKIINGDLNCGNAEIVTYGGTVDSMREYIPDALKLNMGDKGLFFCENSFLPSIPAPSDNPHAFDVFADRQGAFIYSGGYLSHPISDTIVPYWTGSLVKFFPHPIDAVNYLSYRFGHPYTSCELDTGITADFSWYPNPVTDDITMRVPGDAPANLTLYDMTGRMVWQEPPPGLNGQRAIEISGYRHLLLQQEDLSSLKPGAYIGKAIAGGHVYTLKLIKM